MVLKLFNFSKVQYPHLERENGRKEGKKKGKKEWTNNSTTYLDASL